MTNKLEKCPNCGHIFKDGEKFCPNCDLFVPIDEQEDSVKGFNLNETRPFHKFNEHETKKQNEHESLFKHRSRTPNDDLDNDSSVKKEPFQNNESLATEKQNEIPSSEQPKNANNNEKLDNELVSLQEDSTDAKDDNALLVPEKTDDTARFQENKKKKWVIGVIIIILIAIGCGIYYSVYQKKSAESDRVALVSKATDSIDSLYLTKEHDYLKLGITQSDIDKAKDSLNKLKTKTGYDALKKQYDDAEEKFNKQEAINALFNEPILTGNQLADNVYVKNSTAISLNKVTKETDGFYKLYNEAIDVATTQKDELKQVEEKVAVVFKDDQVVDSATREEYDEAKEAVDSLKNEELKDAYNEDLEKVASFLTEKEEKAAEDAARAEEEKKAAAQKEANNSTNNSTNNSASGSSASHRWGNRQDATIDLSDPAWTWNPGIKEEVITEVIRRGYVVDGGYTLVPKYIENGTGFYDLYATTNSRIFPNSKPSEFPLFVVTIDDKTGSFYGNGPN